MGRHKYDTFAPLKSACAAAPGRSDGAFLVSATEKRYEPANWSAPFLECVLLDWPATEW